MTEEDNALFESYFGSFWLELSMFKLLIILNAVIGWLQFEWAWRKTRRFRKPI